MFTGYLVGFIAFRALFDRNPVMSTAGGILGLVFGMLLETLLFIIRTTDYSDRSSTSRRPSNLKIKKNQ
ncbi:DNA translocase FtsK [Bienertia sinuspersici]